MLLQYVAVVLQSFDFGSQVVVPVSHSHVAEPQVVLVLSGNCELVLNVSHFGLQVEELSLESALSVLLAVQLDHQVSLLTVLSVQVSLQRRLFGLKSLLVVLQSGQLRLRGVEQFRCSAKLIVSLICLFAE